MRSIGSSLSAWHTCWVSALGALILLAGTAGCGDDDDPEFVTVKGVVINIDKAVPAANVKVTLLGTSYSSPETGSNGQYTIRVPRGSKLELHTDDFAPATDDRWFPLINVDVPAIVANGNLDFWPIHCCPQTQAPDSGSVALWDQYLALADDQDYGDRYVPTRSADASAIISIIAGGCESGTRTDATGFEFSFEPAEFPVGYGKLKFMTNSLDPGAGTDLLYPADRAVSDTSGWVLSWGDPSFTGTSVRTTVRDTLSTRDLAFVSPFDIPVRPGTISLVWYIYVNGQANRSFLEAGQCLGIFPTSRIAESSATSPDLRP